eukprot:TRINITY_DN3223_c1_g1_i1.p4 TRINITY_DN3223_c1_g1~~TRINITY_DN3223_c1_g1_i1.p4  ORF type:complete len:123 (+),score=4.61 TRINITY_DN3223_c1_g1_i1:160-528(+)
MQIHHTVATLCPQHIVRFSNHSTPFSQSPKSKQAVGTFRLENRVFSTTLERVFTPTRSLASFSSISRQDVQLCLVVFQYKGVVLFPPVFVAPQSCLGTEQNDSTFKPNFACMIFFSFHTRRI